MSNFKFLQSEWPAIYETCVKIEQKVFREPQTALIYMRFAVEQSLYKIFETNYLFPPEDNRLTNLISVAKGLDMLNLEIDSDLHYLRTQGNNAAHYNKRRFSSKDSLIAVQYLFRYLKWFCNRYNGILPEFPSEFDSTLLPKLGAEAKKTHSLKKELKELQADFEQLTLAHNQQQKQLQLALKRNQAQQKQFEVDKAAQQERLSKNMQERPQAIPRIFTEAETRQHLIDLDLSNVGWTLGKDSKMVSEEYKVTGMPISAQNPQGNGFVDYVLWDDNGQPLALIEAKRTSKSPLNGQQQALLYANCLEQTFGQRPIIFLSNGLETYIYEDQFYASYRRVHGFYSKEELQWKQNSYQTRKNILLVKPNPDIAGRPYQTEAIQRVCEAFCIPVKGKKSIGGDKRRALLTMATGTGKTRTAIALSDILLKNKWAKRILFLADRKALVNQAKRSFGDHLKEFSAVVLGGEDESKLEAGDLKSTRLVFSTYQTMINRIDHAREENNALTFGAGHFDLIIIDEAHRSIYNRYTSIFEYFDSLLVGLTATPKKSIDHNTFGIFGCADEDPTFEYTLTEAVEQGYLVPYKNIKVKTKFLDEGIKFSELSEKEKAKYEESFSAQGDYFVDEVDSQALNKWFFNKDTVHKILQTLMEEGIRVEDGDKLGKTIIFAANQKHAEFIEKCFRELYPEVVLRYTQDKEKKPFIATIHNKTSHVETLINNFCEQEGEDQQPQIAVSVDMLDTGIDAPSVVNLVFFKKVRSYAKFWQMIGRGTRLCPDIFGPGKDKEAFLIFDACNNFEFFEEQQEGVDSKAQKTMSQLLFEHRLDLSQLLIEGGVDEDISFATELRQRLYQQVMALDKESFRVKMQRPTLLKFQEENAWENLSIMDIEEIKNNLGPLVGVEDCTVVERNFLLSILRSQIQLLEKQPLRSQFCNNMMRLSTDLSKKYNIQTVHEAKEVIEQLQDPSFYEQQTARKLEQLKEDLRHLLVYLDKQERVYIYTDISDELSMVEERPSTLSMSGSAFYKKRVESYLNTNRNNLTISKILQNKPIEGTELKALENILCDEEQLGDRSSYEETLGGKSLVHFIRGILGMDRPAVEAAFAKYLQDTQFTADQQNFVRTIVDYICKNGLLEPSKLFEDPFNYLHDNGIFGVFPNTKDCQEIVSIIRKFNDVA